MVTTESCNPDKGDTIKFGAFYVVHICLWNRFTLQDLYFTTKLRLQSLNFGGWQFLATASHWSNAAFMGRTIHQISCFLLFSCLRFTGHPDLRRHVNKRMNLLVLKNNTNNTPNGRPPEVTALMCTSDWRMQNWDKRKQIRAAMQLGYSQSRTPSALWNVL